MNSLASTDVNSDISARVSRSLYQLSKLFTIRWQLSRRSLAFSWRGKVGGYLSNLLARSKIPGNRTWISRSRSMSVFGVSSHGTEHHSGFPRKVDFCLVIASMHCLVSSWFRGKTLLLTANGRYTRLKN
jgi:hypothetical protein